MDQSTEFPYSGIRGLGELSHFKVGAISSTVAPDVQDDHLPGETVEEGLKITLRIDVKIDVKKRRA